MKKIPPALSRWENLRIVLNSTDPRAMRSILTRERLDISIELLGSESSEI